MTEWRRWLRFNGVGLLGAGVQIATIHVLTSDTRLDYRVATVTGVAVALVHNFAWHWRWTWADRRAERRVFKTFFAFAATNGFISTLGNLAAMPWLIGTLHLPTTLAATLAIAACTLANYGSARITWAVHASDHAAAYHE